MFVNSKISYAFASMVDVVLPQGCWAGGTIADDEPAYGLSEKIRLQVARLAAQPYCFYCGLTVGPHEFHDKSAPCGRCFQRRVGVARVARVGTFSGPLVTLVHRLKFGQLGGTWEIARVLAPFIYQAMLQVSEETGTHVDLMVPVPLHWSRQMHRGFNQADELAREVCGLSRWKVAGILRRGRSTREQARLENPTQRQENVRGAFSCRANAPFHAVGKHVWLIDDVSTTGATLHAAAIALRKLPREQQPASINAAVVCVTDHRAPALSAMSATD